MKLRGLINKGFIAIITLIILSSCSQDISLRVNKDFKSKYAEQVQMINAHRQNSRGGGGAPLNIEDFNQDNNPFLARNSAPSPMMQMQAQNPRQDQRQSQRSTQREQDPNAPQKIPQDVFDLNYNLALNPPFMVFGHEFDTIEIPSYDFYGIKSTMDDKPYLIAGNLALQKDIDFINNSRDDLDVEISETLIKEQKELRRQQKLKKIYSGEATELEKQKIKEENDVQTALDARKKRLAQEDPLKKAIALQVVQQNMRQNNPNANASGGNANGDGGNKK